MRFCKTLLHRPRLEAAMLFLLISTMASAQELTPQRQDELHNLILQDCGSCHGMTLKGGLGSALRPADLDGVDPSTIAHIILNGVPGKPMPPWRGLLSDSEAIWIAHALKAGVVK